MKAYKFVKEFGEGVDRICTELEQTGTPLLVFHPNYFILQTTLYEEVIDVPANARIATDSTQKSAEKEEKSTGNNIESAGKEEKSTGNVVETTRKKLGKTARKIVELMRVNPQITIPELAEAVHTKERNIGKHTSNLQAKGIIRRVKGRKEGHWEIIE